MSLSGGGSKGAYEAGVLHTMAYTLSSSESRIDVVSGISAGGINAAGLSVFPVGKEKEAADYLVEKWSTMENDYVW